MSRYENWRWKCSREGAAAAAFSAAVAVVLLVRKHRKWRLLQAAVATGIWRSELLYWGDDDVAAVVDWVGFADSIVEVMGQKFRIKLGSLIHSIIGNLKPSIIHIRYEDLGSNPGHFGRIQHRRRERQQQRATATRSSKE
ncbi:hypothetical protein F0562_032288 [Nyssa sinensis]|uniref:Uncharacterized protein n=1 Tax=Nyssa sinensis TaxID=561372 RepID=A0A5J5AMD0_9ASTE|nr:hypothetical protein F0562_032288 [Nyssa sinensis]